LICSYTDICRVPILRAPKWPTLHVSVRKLRRLFDSSGTSFSHTPHGAERDAIASRRAHIPEFACNDSRSRITMELEDLDDLKTIVVG
jgi:hypothetical protein